MIKEKDGGPSRKRAFSAFQGLGSFQPAVAAEGGYPYPTVEVSNLFAAGAAL